jgi:predicted secreted protein
VDNITARADFIDVVLESAQGADLIQGGGLFNVGVSESAFIADVTSSRFLWEPINNSQTSDWQSINNTQTTDWTPITT